MQTIIEVLNKKFKKAALTAFPNLANGEESFEVEVTQSSNEKFGHYQCNSAMKLARPLQINPRMIAQKIVDEFQNEGEFSSITIAGPGFINVTVDAPYLSRMLQKIFEDPHLGASLPPKAQRVVIDFSSPNVAKEMHVGHLRSTIIGDSLARLFEFLGHDVLRLNHVGDWGTQFGMLIAFLKEEVSDSFKNQSPDLLSLMNWYKSAKKKFDAEEPFRERAKQEVVRLQGGDPNSLATWEKICEISRRGYQEIYDLLEVKVIERGESFYNEMLPGVLEEMEKKGVISHSEGAKCVFLDGFVNREGDPLPLIIQKSDGGFNYATTDLAALKQRTEVERADRVVYVTDLGQKNHFSMMFQAARKSGFYDASKVQVDHVPFGLVLGPDGKKFKTRSGQTEKLIDLLTQAVDRARQTILEKGSHFSEDQLQKMAQVLGIGAVKYADLSCHRTGDYAFSYDRMLRFEGNTATFLMYAYVRVAGVKRKVQADIESISKTHSIQIQHPTEVSLGLHLCRFGEVLSLLLRELAPHHLTEYLFELAQKFNAFYRDCRIEGDPNQDSRLLLCEVVARVMKKGLFLLGVETIEQM